MARVFSYLDWVAEQEWRRLKFLDESSFINYDEAVCGGTSQCGPSYWKTLSGAPSSLPLRTMGQLVTVLDAEVCGSLLRVCFSHCDTRSGASSCCPYEQFGTGEVGARVCDWNSGLWKYICHYWDSRNTIMQLCLKVACGWFLPPFIFCCCYLEGSSPGVWPHSLWLVSEPTPVVGEIRVGPYGWADCLGFVVSVEMDEALSLSHFRLAHI
eukprot:g59550.t1